MKAFQPTLACLLLLAPGAAGDVLGFEIDERSVVAQGHSFGDAGAYEKLRGRILFGFDPEDPDNAAVVDLALAPRDAQGLVRADADFLVLQPVDPERRRGTALLEVSNRGGMAGLGYFCVASRSSSNPGNLEHFGDALTLELGLTLVWVGWQFDVPESASRLRLRVPRIVPEGEPLVGPVRCDWVVDSPAQVLELGHRSHVPYPVHQPLSDAHRLTVRDGRLSERRAIERSRWSFTPEPAARSATGIRLEGGFEPGHIYELVYQGTDPAPVGLGFLALRDTLVHAKTAKDSLFPIEQAIAYGISQTGRFLRHYLHAGIDPKAGTRAFDGLMILTAGAGRGSFNHRFAQPSRDAHRYSAFFYPTDIFPFTSRRQRDGLLGRSEGLWDHLRAPAPRVMLLNTGYEYWGRAAGLVHTSLDGAADVAPMENERIYHLASTQHFVGGAPRPGRTRGVWSGNSLDFKPTARALLVSLVHWVESDREPPPSRVPRIDDGTLVGLAEFTFPAIPGVTPPRVAQEAYRADYGPRFRREGIVDQQPPLLGLAFPTLVPAVDAHGNERGGIPNLETLVPLATWMPWSLRAPDGEGIREVGDFVGQAAPFPRTEEERQERSDPRPSLEALYGDRAGYEQALRSGTDELLDGGWLLEQDVARVVERALATWDWIYRDR